MTLSGGNGLLLFALNGRLRAEAAQQPTVRDTFADRYAMDSFSDRYSAASGYRPVRATASNRTNPLPAGSYKVASLSPELPYAGLPAIKQAQTSLIGFAGEMHSSSSTKKKNCLRMAWKSLMMRGS